MHPYLHLFGHDFPVYGMFCALGVLCAILALCFLVKLKISRDDALFCALYAVIGGFIGAKILYFITILPELFDGSHGFWELLTNGFVFYGGIPGGVAGVWLYCRGAKIPMMDAIDPIAACLPLGHAFGRVGCLMAGCCYGMEYHGALCIELGGTCRFPVQPLESLLLLCLAAFLILWTRRKRLYFKGEMLGLYLCIYGVMRFCLEFLRGDAERGSVLFLSTSQFISIFALIAGAFLLLRRKKEAEKE